jgi:hypothetical protein
MESKIANKATFFEIATSPCVWGILVSNVAHILFSFA